MRANETARHDRGPNPLRDEVVRPRLVDRLAGRWNVSLTLVEAAGGYGKSVALAQAMRDNDQDPTGVDVYVACRRPDAGAGRLARRILRVMDAPVVPGSSGLAGDVGPDGDVSVLVDALVTALARRSPARVALVLDDVHHLAADPGSAELLGVLVKRLPSNAHLVLAGRELPVLPIARLQAADDVLRIGADELVFTPAEVADLAAFHDADPGALLTADGWPALTRLAITVGRVASVEYLIEEVVDTLDPAAARATALVAIARRIDPEVLRSLTGIASPARFVAQIPLMSADARGWVTAHDMWSEALDTYTSQELRCELASDVARWMCDAGRHDEAVEVAEAHGAWRAALDALVGFVGGGAPFPSAVRASSWLARIPAALHSEPEVVLTRGFVARLNGDLATGAVDADAALAAFEERGDVDAIAAAGFEVGFGAWTRGDLARVFDVYGLARRLVDAGNERLRPMVLLVEAVVADLEGDHALARSHLQSVDHARIPASVVTYALRLESSLSAVLGETVRCVETADRLQALDPTPYADFTAVLARWYHGDIVSVMAVWPEMRLWSADYAQEDFNLAAYATLIDASFGLATARPALDGFDAPRSREQSIRSIARAAAAVVDGDEDRAAASTRDLMALVAAGDRMALGELRRLPAIPYVLSEAARSAIDGIHDLGPRQLTVRRIARAVVDGRAGRAVDWRSLPELESVLCAVPLPWAVELACVAAAQRDAIAPQFAERLIEVAGRPAVDWFERSARLQGPIGTGACAVLSGLPAPPSRATAINVFGPMRVDAGPHVDPAVLRRARVRALLGLLVVEERVSVARVLSLMWPELGEAPARNNLRVTLSLLRGLLEPGRPPGSPSFHVGRSATHLWLRRSEHLCCDLWEVDRLLDAGSIDERRGDLRKAVESYGLAVELWAGDLVPDLRDDPVVAAGLVQVELRLAHAAALVAEWSLAEHDPAAAIVAAERVLHHDPYHERAHAALISAHLFADDVAAATAAADRCREALAELRVAPDPATAMALRRVERALRATGSHERGGDVR